MPPLSFKPESFGQLCDRFPRAIDWTFDVESIAYRDGMRPGELRAHVFDAPDGLRLIVSRDVLEGRIYRHVSGSYTPDGEVSRVLRNLAGKVGVRSVLDFLAELVLKRYRELSGDAAVFELRDDVSAKGVPHWFRQEE